MSDYFEWAGDFQHVYLEDSYVLDIEELDGQLVLVVDLVLTEDHPKYSIPHEDEQYCYKKGTIVFQDVEQVRWLEKSMRPSTDANGEVDFGNVDYLELSPEGYHFGGDWGEVLVDSSPPNIVWDAQ